MMSSIHVNSFGSAAFECAVAETQGHRDTYEDAVAVSLSQQSADMWLLDGHHGDAAARFGAPALAKELGPAIKGDKLPSHERISQSFRAVDNQLRQAFKEQPDNAKAGSTVVGLLASKQRDGKYHAQLINCGDSRGIVMQCPNEDQSPVKQGRHSKCSKLCDGVSPVKHSKHSSRSHRVRRSAVIVESTDHKPDEPGEKARILAAGGRVQGDGKTQPARIDGKLAVSRGLGDFKYKSDSKRPAAAQKVTCTPDIYEMSDLQPGTLVLLACDGLWDVMTTNDVASLISARMHGEGRTDLADIAHDLVSASLRKKSRDNVTVLLAQFVEDSDRSQSDRNESDLASESSSEIEDQAMGA